MSYDFVPKIYDSIFKKCKPKWQLPPHFVDHYEITYIIKGNAHYTINGKDNEINQGGLICLTDGTEISAVTNAKNAIHYFSVNFDALYPLISNVPPPPLFPLVSHIGIRQDIINLFREITISWENKQEGYIMKSRALLMLILHRLSEILLGEIDNTTGDYRINKTISFIITHYSENISVKKLAELVHLDHVYFGHLFKQQTGKTVHQYITQIRIQNAENMLQSGSYKVYEVAEQCGFSDVIHFYKAFKTLRGFPPSRCIPRN